MECHHIFGIYAFHQHYKTSNPVAALPSILRDLYLPLTQAGQKIVRI